MTHGRDGNRGRGNGNPVAAVSETLTYRDLANQTGLSEDVVIEELQRLQQLSREPVSLLKLSSAVNAEVLALVVGGGLLVREGRGGPPKAPSDAVVQTHGFNVFMASVNKAAKDMSEVRIA